MSSIQDVSAEQLAKLLHHYREALAEDFECNSIEDDERTWDCWSWLRDRRRQNRTANILPSRAKPTGAAKRNRPLDIRFAGRAER
jgi:hypothetical protein